MSVPVQKILFGSPGTGKSFKVRQIAAQELGIEGNTSPNIIKTVFHPEYSYGDFMGKLLPYGQGNNVTYRYYSGHFLKALGRAYRNILDCKPSEDAPRGLLTCSQCLLIIDELNRGNASAIFGTAFQLLDREEDGWSSYEVDLSDLEMVGLLNAIGYKAKVNEFEAIQIPRDDASYTLSGFCELLRSSKSDELSLRLLSLLKEQKISLPPNLSIIGTINTSDESIYYLDSAFKRRWDWEYMPAPTTVRGAPEGLKGMELILNDEFSDQEKVSWIDCIVVLNAFITSQHQSIRRIEDKQIGWWFIKPIEGKVTLQQVKDKLLFYLWDTVFSKDRRPLEKVVSDALNKNVKLVTFADFTMHVKPFIKQLLKNHALDLIPF